MLLEHQFQYLCLNLKKLGVVASRRVKFYCEYVRRLGLGNADCLLCNHCLLQNEYALLYRSNTAAPWQLALTAEVNLNLNVPVSTWVGLIIVRK
jgi:hypothetical protein